MVRGNVALRPSGAVITTIEYPCGQCANYTLKPGSKQGELMRRLHARGCKDCMGQQGKLVETHLPTKVGNAAQISKAVAREFLASGSSARVNTVLGKNIAPAIDALNQIQTARLAALD